MRRKVYALANESSWIKNSGIVMSQTSYFLSAKSSPERITNRIVASLDFFETPEELGKVISGFFRNALYRTNKKCPRFTINFPQESRLITSIGEYGYSGFSRIRGFTADEQNRFLQALSSEYFSYILQAQEYYQKYRHGNRRFY
jgi:hypothetical protein